ncbi:MAG: PEP-CTERM sorting domain-containing protein [Candidatus Solibacter sp.]
MAVFKKAFLGVIFMVSCAAAAPLCTTLTTLQDYINQGTGGCALGDKVFFNFSYLYSTGGNPNVAASAVTVGTLVTNGGLDYALTFTGNWTSSGPINVGSRTSDITLNFSVTAPPVLPIVRTDLTLRGNIFYTKPIPPSSGGVNESPGRITSAESFTGSSSGNLPALSMTTLTNAPNSALQTLTTGVTLPATTFIRVSKDINLFSGGSANAVTYNNPNYLNESVKLVSFTESFSETQVPEPAVFLTFGGGLLLIGLAGRRRRQAMGSPLNTAATSIKDNKNNSEAL